LFFRTQPLDGHSNLTQRQWTLRASKAQAATLYEQLTVAFSKNDLLENEKTVASDAT
jgi:hypothetical protein